MLETGVGLDETIVELHVKYGLSKLLSWLLDILNIVSFTFLSKSPDGPRDHYAAITSAANTTSNDYCQRGSTLNRVFQQWKPILE